MKSPVVQIFDMSDDDAQQLAVGLLRDVDDVAVRPAFSGPDRYVVVECDDSARAQTIYRLVTSIDPRATLIHTTNGGMPNFESPFELNPD